MAGRLCLSLLCFRLPFFLSFRLYLLLDAYRMPKSPNAHRVIVIGAGASGLSLAIELGRLHKEHVGDKKKLHITLLEATSSVGGRIRTIRTNCNDETSSNFLSLAPSRQEYWKRRYEKFYPYPIPLGAEFVHGDENNPAIMGRVIRNQLKQQQQRRDTDNVQETSHSHEWELELVVDYSNKSPNLTIFADGKCFRWYDGSTVHKEAGDSPWPSYIDKAKKIWAELLEVKEGDSDKSLEDFVNDNYAQIAGAKDEQQYVLSILNVVYAATAASTSALLGVKETSRQENAWPYGEKNFRLGGCYSELVDELLMELESINDSPDVTVDIKTNCPVQVMSFNSSSNTSVKLVCPNQRYECDCVGVTVPLAVLNSGQLQFSGDCMMLKKKQHIINATNVLGGGKVHALIKWGVDLKKPQTIDLKSLQGIFVCPEEAFNQIWFRWDNDSILVTGFCVFGGKTDCERDPAYLETSLKSLVTRILSKAIQGDIVPKSHDGNRYLTFSAFDVYDWLEDKYVHGMYSSPSISSSGQFGAATTSQHLAEPISQCVYFAGEHTHDQACATVQSALESGIRAAREIYQHWTR
jgi:hypothetical protein